ncbi:NudC domain-containing protein 2 [Zea mays]|uniref:NudC domain-containing protein 2 n=1 Tax=Zea mays TaxID=4577 RepID=A0A1D6H1R0_MAIZE|nr:NudC domain-containing protein 2 [Zea mays]
MAENLAPEKRHTFVHNGQKVFEWDQTLEEVNMYIELPKGVPTKLFHCTIQASHVEHDLMHPVKTDSSFWTIGVAELIALEHLIIFFLLNHTFSFSEPVL